MAKMNYMLRKTLIPWRMQETIDEVCDYCLANKVGEVIWKTDVEIFNRGFTSLETIKEYIPWLKKAKAKFDAANITTSVNPWMTLNHSDYYGNDNHKNFPGMHWIVDHTGTQSKACACPLCDVFQRHLVDAYSLYAEVKPHILWVEDDFRHFNHEPVSWGCFCKIHLEKFSKIIGRKINREELVKYLLQPGPPHPYRAEWMDFLGDNMVKLAGKVESAVHRIGPQTKIGLMSSSPDDHSIEGRKWHQLINSFAGKNRAVLRPHYPPYRNTDIFDIYTGLDTIRHTVHCLPKNVQICPELENAPFTEYVKSVAYSKLQIMLSASMGYSDITMNLYDHCGTALNKNDAYGIMLRETKPFLDGLLRYCEPDGKHRGIGLLFSTDSAKHTQTQTGGDFTELHPKGYGWSVPLQAMGFPVTFSDSDIIAVTGQTTRGYAKEQVLKILSGGVLLDASAAEVLLEDGFGKYIGVEIEEKLSRKTTGFAAENIGDEVYISPRLATEKEVFFKLRLHDNAKAVSNFVTPDRKFFMPGMVQFENSLGGRITVYPMDLSNGATCCFLSWHRQKQLKDVIDWLSRGRNPLWVGPGPYAVPLRIDYDNYSILVIANNSPDVWKNTSVEFNTESKKVKQILILDKTGSWTKAKLLKHSQNGDMLSFTADTELEYLHLSAYRLKY